MSPSLAPWLTVPDGHRAVDFYRSAFDAQEVYRLEVPDGSLIVRLSVGGAEFWISGEPAAGGATTGRVSDGATAAGVPDEMTTSRASLGGNNLRMILTVPDPDAVFAQALLAGAVEVFPVGEGHGWRLGRLIDPFGLHWEIGRPLD
jgi:PhnB protein